MFRPPLPANEREVISCDEPSTCFGTSQAGAVDVALYTTASVDAVGPAHPEVDWSSCVRWRRAGAPRSPLWRSRRPRPDRAAARRRRLFPVSGGRGGVAVWGQPRRRNSPRTLPGSYRVRRIGARGSAGHRHSGAVPDVVRTIAVRTTAESIVVRRTEVGSTRWSPLGGAVHRVEPLDGLHPVAMRDIGWTPLSGRCPASSPQPRSPRPLKSAGPFMVLFSVSSGNGRLPVE